MTFDNTANRFIAIPLCMLVETYISFSYGPIIVITVAFLLFSIIEVSRFEKRR